MGEEIDGDAVEVVGGMHDADGVVAAKEKRVEAFGDLAGARQTVVQGLVSVGGVEIGTGNGQIDADGGSEQSRTEEFQFLSKTGGLLVASAGDVVVVENSAPVFLCAEAAAAPAEKEQGIRAVGDGGEGHAPHFAGLGGVVQVMSLPAGAGLLFGDEEVSGEGADVVEIEGLGWGAMGGVPAKKRVGIVAEKVEVAAEVSAVVDAGKTAVVGDPGAGLEAAEDVDLFALETGHAPTQKAMIIEDMGGVEVGGTVAAWRFDVVEAGIGHGPEVGAPGAIEGGDVAVEFGVEEFAEGVLGVGRMVFGKVAVEFVVGLPADDVGVVGVVFGESAGDAAAVFAEEGAEVGGVLAGAVAEGASRVVDAGAGVGSVGVAR